MRAINADGLLNLYSGLHEDDRIMVGQVRIDINAMPTVTEKEVIAELKLDDKELNKIKEDVIKHFTKHGHWEAINKDGRGYADAFECSACHLVTNYPYFTDDCNDYEYCPHCGAAMDEVTE